jgi:CubicO group peptidase (beta-lactamase class C family)
MFSMNGVGTQRVFMIPSRQLAVVRLGHYKGAVAGDAALKRAMGLLMEAVPALQ